MKRIVITCSLLLSAVFNSNAATTGNYSSYYEQYKNGAFWVDVTKMGNTTVSNGLGIWDGQGTGGAGIVSESMGYAMVLAALYDDKITFDRLSATIQAGIPYGKSGTPTNLFPWSWKSSTSTTTFSAGNNNNTNPYDSASDGDINIALGYIYADKAKSVYGWSDPSSGSTYETMAKNYIAAIRLRDFTTASGQSDANEHILCGGADLASGGFPSWAATWHPDYSDIRAYQIFSKYDTSYANFWQSAISYTKESWKAILCFGSTDTRSPLGTAEPSYGYGKYLSPTTTTAWLANAAFDAFSFSNTYTSVLVDRQYILYTSDAARMPLRIMNYVNASENDDLQMDGIATALLSSLGLSYANSNFSNGSHAIGGNYSLLGYEININTPFTTQNGAGWDTAVQDFVGAGLLALSSNTQLSPLQGVCSRSDVYNNLVTDFGPNGDYRTNRAVNTDTSDDNGNDFNDASKAYNCSVTLWGLTINQNSQNSLQRAIEVVETGIGTATNSVSATSTRSSSTPVSSEKSPSINSSSTVSEVKDIVRSRIQAALASQVAGSVEDIGSVATILGVSKSNLSEALKLAPASIKSSNGKINIAKLGKFLTKNSKAASLLSGKSTGKTKKSSAKRSS
jgi:hypothetical protein